MGRKKGSHNRRPCGYEGCTERAAYVAAGHWRCPAGHHTQREMREWAWEGFIDDAGIAAGKLQKPKGEDVDAAP